MKKIHIYYRLCDQDDMSKRPTGYSKENCFNNFLKVYERIKGKQSFSIVCDGEFPEWLTIKPFMRFVQLGNVGNAQSFWRAYNEALKCLDDDWVYFAEDDYIYLPNAMEELELAMQSLNVDFITLYDHPGRYEDLPEHNLTDGKNVIKLSGSRHWRSSPSTPMTFAASVKALRACYDLFDIWTNRDGYTVSWELFPRLQGLRGEKDYGFRLMGPMPSLATHCVTGYLSPCVDWKMS
jgi:hypothetical protein